MKNQHVALCTANIGLYVPFDFVPIPADVQMNLMQFKGNFIQKAKETYPEINFSKKLFRENLLLYIDINYDSGAGQYETDFSVEIEAWFAEPENNNIIYYDSTSEEFELNLSEPDAHNIKKIIMKELTDVFF